jgi:hypothetical protein
MITKATLALIVAVAAHRQRSLDRSTAIIRLVGKRGPDRQALITRTGMDSMHMPQRRASYCWAQLLLNAILARTSIKALIAAFRTTPAAKV